MNDYVIIADTACDLNADLRKRFGVADYVRGIIYFPDGHEEKITLDWEKMTPDEYYASMKGRKVLYRTAAPSMGEFTEKFEAQLSAGKDILFISISSALSSTYKDSLIVAKELCKKYPGRHIVCVDSLRYSTSLALLIADAARKRDEGLSLNELADYINEEKVKIHEMGAMDDLFFLCKTGRISNFKALFGSMVGINALADFNEVGLSESIGTVKGKKDALEAIIRYVGKTIVNPKEQIIFLAHSARKEAVELLAERIKAEFEPKEIIIAEVGMSCGTNIGPGLCACFYKGEPISSGLATEKGYMNEIIAELKNK